MLRSDRLRGPCFERKTLQQKLILLRFLPAPRWGTRRAAEGCGAWAGAGSWGLSGMGNCTPMPCTLLPCTLHPTALHPPALPCSQPRGAPALLPVLRRVPVRSRQGAERRRRRAGAGGGPEKIWGGFLAAEDQEPPSGGCVPSQLQISSWEKERGAPRNEEETPACWGTLLIAVLALICCC